MCSRQAYHHKRRGHHGHFKRWAHAQRQRHGRYTPPVNVLELDDKYEIYLLAPGRLKDDFKVSLADNVLTVEAEKKDLADEGKWQRREYSIVEFSRSFELNDKVDTDSIDAEYEGGVLKLTLSKKEGSETVRRDIGIA